MGQFAMYRCLLLVSITAAGGPSIAQWTASVLPEGVNAIARGIHGEQIVGHTPAGPEHALLWQNGEGRIDLHPAGPNLSTCWGVHGGVQVGSVRYDTIYHAAAWEGSASSFIDLHPLTTEASATTDIFGGIIVGYTRIGSSIRAAMWTSLSSSSWIDLHPAEATTSGALKTDGVLQVGAINFGSGQRACIWSGTQASYRSIHPPQYVSSLANSVRQGIVGGYVNGGSRNEAAIWTGREFTVRSLHPYSTLPFGSTASQVNGLLNENLQVGQLATNSQPEAGVWEGTAGTWQSLEQFLPLGSYHSYAMGVASDDENIYVVGSAIVDGFTSAILWTTRRTTTVAPSAVTVSPGSVVSGDLNSILTSDNVGLQARPGPVFSGSTPPIQYEFTGTSTVQNPASVEFAVESRTSMDGGEINIWLFNFVAGVYELIKTGLSKPGDTTQNAFVGEQAGRFVSPGSLTMKARVTYRATAPMFAFPWHAFVDRAIWKMPPVN